MRVEALAPEHVFSLAMRPAHAAWAARLAPDEWAALAVSGWTVFLHDRPVACGGFADLGGGRADAWAVIPIDIGGPALVACTWAARRGLELTDFRRVQAQVPADFQPGRRWVQLLGFHFEGTMRAYCDQGQDAELWARVR